MNNRKITALFFNLVLALALAITTLPAQAAVPQTLNYQGQLASAAGVPVNATVNITFSLYDVATGGAALWVETKSVAVSNGLYSVTLGAITPLTPTLFGVPLYLGISVAADAEMTQRIALSSSATALRAATADSATTATSATTASHATLADAALQADHATIADAATTATTATIATTANALAPTATVAGSQIAGAVNATTLGGLAPEAFAGADALATLNGQVATLSTAVNTSMGDTYIRWGRTACPSGSSLIYSGYAAGSHSTHTGGGADLLCLAGTPSWGDFNDGFQGGAILYGVEFGTSGYGVASLAGVHNYEARCAACFVSAKKTIMVPGTQVCPSGWDLQYSGYLMSSHYTENKSQHVCVDAAPEVAGSALSSNSTHLFPTEASCGTLPCLPYVQNREVTCSVCSKQ